MLMMNFLTQSFNLIMDILGSKG